jgi:hypothetical protein
MFEIGIVKAENVSDKFKGIAGVKLIVADIRNISGKEERLVINPVTKEGFEIFYNDAFEIMGKELISDDYQYFLEYMIDGDCEFTCHIPASELEDLRPVKKEEIDEANESFKWFTEKHNIKLTEAVVDL